MIADAQHLSGQEKENDPSARLACYIALTIFDIVQY
jgi:hypothetical protein